MDTLEKLAVLADAAKYDASCASSGTQRRDSAGRPGMGSTGGTGICHAYAPDGRCISLLKILLTNFCMYECHYCVNRNSSNTRRARFSVKEVVDLTLSFYQRNYIEGLFLSSGVIRNPDYTMQQLVEVARCLREDHHFRGYIHLKTIPDADGELLADAGRHADRLSINVELPTVDGLSKLAPDKDPASIRRSMARIRDRIDQRKDDRRAARRVTNRPTVAPPVFAPAGQSTQMIVGADAATDRDILTSSSGLYSRYALKRVYYSAFSPIPGAPAALPSAQAPLLREHRLYQSDWLIRFYGFEHNEILDADTDGMLDLAVDPKLAWALRHREYFPVDLNRATKEQILRVPGLGTRTVAKLLTLRRRQRIHIDHLSSLRSAVRRAMPFITCDGHHAPAGEVASDRLHAQFSGEHAQLTLALAT